MKDINEVIEIINKKPRKVSLFIANDWKYKLMESIVKSKNKRDFKKVMSKAMKIPDVKKNGKEAVKIIQSLTKDVSKISTTIIKKSKELETIVQAKDYLAKEFGVKVEIIDADNSNEAKARAALPGKPGILIE